MKEKWQQFSDRIEELTLRERILVALMVIALFAGGLQFLLVDPLLAGAAQSEKNKVAAEARVAELQQQLADLQKDLQGQKRKRMEEQIQAMQAEVDRLDEQLAELTVNLIDPAKMASVIERVLAESSSLTLLSLENRPVETVLDRGQVDAETDPGRGDEETPEVIGQLYRHSFVLTVKGSYFDTLKYFQALEALPWHFYWDGMDYEVEEYPDATVTLHVHTLSTQKDWIGV